MLLRRLLRALKDESGISAPELIMIAGLASVLGYLTWSALRTPVVGAGGTVGNKVNNAVGTSNPTW